MKKIRKNLILLLTLVFMAGLYSCNKDGDAALPDNGGDTTVEFGDGGTKATAIRNLVVEGVTYDVEFKSANPSEIYGAYSGTYTFNTDEDATAAVNAINTELDKALANVVGEDGLTFDETRYRIGYESFQTSLGNGVQDNCRMKLGLKEPDWKVGPEESSLWIDDLVIWAVFTEL
jgi:hypothetical protein